MSIGMKRQTVYLEEHQAQWEEAAAETVGVIKRILADTVVDVRHVGSTSIKSIPAKPIIDIAVGVKSYDEVLAENDCSGGKQCTHGQRSDTSWKTNI